MKRMVSLISEQVLPNFIPLKEPATRPEVLHGIFTPTDANMVRRWDNLKNVIVARFPNMRTEDVPIKDAYDAQAIQQQCANLIQDHPDDDWALNMTGGTKLMSAPGFPQLLPALTLGLPTRVARVRCSKVSVARSMRELLRLLNPPVTLGRLPADR